MRSCGLEDYKPPRTNMVKMKLGGELELVQYSRINVPESVHMGHPAVGNMEMVKARNSARGHLMAWLDKQAMKEYLKDLMTDSNLKRKEYGTGKIWWDPMQQHTATATTRRTLWLWMLERSIGLVTSSFRCLSAYDYRESLRNLTSH